MSAENSQLVSHFIPSTEHSAWDLIAAQFLNECINEHLPHTVNLPLARRHPFSPTQGYMVQQQFPFYTWIIPISNASML